MKLPEPRLRLLPVVLFATASLLALKVVEIADMRNPALLSEGFSVVGSARSLLAEEEIITGATPKPAESKPAEGSATAQAPQPLPPAGQPAAVSPSERAILERLQERRQDIESRLKDIETREQLLRAAEKRIEQRVGELKELEERINATVQKRDEAETARFRSVVTMYENMKAKDAARIFDRLDMRILGDVARAMNPRRLGDIIALMTPEAAERLTIELARVPQATQAPAQGERGGGALPAGELPRIETRPNS